MRRKKKEEIEEVKEEEFEEKWDIKKVILGLVVVLIIVVPAGMMVTRWTKQKLHEAYVLGVADKQETKLQLPQEELEKIVKDTTGSVIEKNENASKSASSITDIFKTVEKVTENKFVKDIWCKFSCEEK